MIKKTLVQYNLQLQEKYPNIKAIGPYESDRHSIKHECLDCGYIWSKAPTNALHNKMECPNCRAERRRAQMNEEFRLAHPQIEISDFKTSNDVVEAKCKKCKNTWSTEYKYVKHFGCKNCHKVKGIKSNLDEPGVFYKILFTHKKMKFQFIKVGITRNSVKERYAPSEYRDYDKEIIFEHRSTISEARQKEVKYMAENESKRFFFPDNIKFNGYTECFSVDQDSLTTTNNLSIIRESMLEAQGGICPLCERPVNNPVCDHEHGGKHKGDGKIRGVICSTCNSLLGSLENAVIRSGVGLENKQTFIKNLRDYTDKKWGVGYIYPTEKPKDPKLMKRSYNKLKKAYTNSGKRAKFPEYPKSSKLTKKLGELFEEFKIEIEYY